MPAIEQAGQFIPDGHFPDDLDGFRLFRFADGQILAQRADISADDGKSHQDKGQDAPLKVFNMKIDALRTEEMEQGDIDPVGQQCENTYIQKTTGIETEYTEEKNENVAQQQDAAGLVGEIHGIHNRKDSGGHLDGRQAGIGHPQIEARAEEYIHGNVDDGNEDQ